MALPKPKATADHLTVVGNTQADQHNRDKNEERAQEHIDARNRLVRRLLPFIYYDDRNLAPVTLLETIGQRLLDEAKAERQRVIDACPEEWRHLL